MAGGLLSICPRYQFAMDAWNRLQDMEYPVPSDSPTHFTNIGVLPIDAPSWAVLLDFVQSETAIRKSERNQPEPPKLSASALACTHNANDFSQCNSKRFSTRLIDSEQYAHGDSVQRSSGTVDASAATTNKLRTN
jgi:hypothetical protein